MNKYLLKLAEMTFQKVFVFAMIVGFIYYSTFFNDGSTIETELSAINTQLAEQQNKLQESEAALKKVEQVRAQVASLSDQFRLISTQMPTEIQMSEVLRTIDSMAATSGVSIKGKEPQKAEVKDMLEEMSLKVLAEGRFSELTLFLYNMMTTERISTIRSLTLSKSSSDQDKRKVKSLILDVKFSNYRFVGNSDKEIK